MVDIIKPGERLFKDKSGIEKNYSSINRNKDLNNDINFMFIIEGYKNSSLELINSLIKSEKKCWLELDTKIYPILFLFRQYLELIIKQTIRIEKIIRDQIEVDEVGFEATHSLQNLWNELKPIIESQYETYENKEELLEYILLVENLVLELHNCDNGSFAFRYPFKNPRITNGKVENNLEEFTIDIVNLKNLMEKIIVYFEGINEHFRVVLDNKQTI